MAFEILLVVLVILTSSEGKYIGLVFVIFYLTMSIVHIIFKIMFHVSIVN